MNIIQTLLDLCNIVVEGVEKRTMTAEQLDLIVTRIKTNGVDNIELKNLQIESTLHQLEKIIDSGFNTEFYLNDIKMIAISGPNNTFRVQCADSVFCPMTRIFNQDTFDFDTIVTLKSRMTTAVEDFINAKGDAVSFYILYTNYIERFQGKEVRVIDHDNNLKYYKYPKTDDMISVETDKPIDFNCINGDEQYVKFVSLFKATMLNDAFTTSINELVSEFHRIMATIYVKTVR